MSYASDALIDAQKIEIRQLGDDNVKLRRALERDADVIDAQTYYIDGLKAENAKLKRAAERDADVMESLNLLLEESQAENAKLRELASLMAVRWLPNDVRMTPDKWRDRDKHIRDELRKLEIEVK